jgi:signal transduction histidine kinase
VFIRVNLRQNSELKIVLVELQSNDAKWRQRFSKPGLGEIEMNEPEQTVSLENSKPSADASDDRQQLEQIVELVARVRHEINNPLTGVLGQAQLLLREELNDRARKRAQAIEDLALRLKDIVAQLRDVKKP